MTETAKKNIPLPGVHRGWYLASGFLVGLVAATGSLAWSTIPQSLPMHWDGAGNVDRYAEKSFWTVFTGPLICLGLLLFLYATALIIRRFPLNNSAPYGVDEQVHQRAGMDSTLYFLALSAFALSLLIGWMTLRSWFLPPEASDLLLVLPTLAFLGVVAVAGLLAWRRYGRLVAALSAED
ncbi:MULTISPECIES: DUF1648 domain-containing protein [Arthrobacter]|uniref:DUF1648 domain-containing protein n=1 Tax=Arthrobacter sunyaminii TaxID=2816859 RepID=A0A975S588_9MICC|nr:MULTISPECIES: DUF1648 domain-containing protein [Arthrobacter]MBO0897272.1 DUF1648 domain-containing protein [Arthrobacter sunyaminii]MBO0908805.1 DUF1648 domain-containing protein [Arthrobacter sunyaminii]QWQ35682.1 DUF1648 domain-containing protein [Arthrobacter sunyaminii]